MNKKTLHLVFGFSGEAILSQSLFVNKEEDDILGFYDTLSLGPLCDLDNAQDIDIRKSWLKKVFGSIESEDGTNYIDVSLTQIKAVIETITKYKCIYLWFGNDANEKITTARLLYHLQRLTIPIFKANFSKAQFKNDKGCITPSSLQVMKADDDILELGKHFEELSEQDKQSFASLWEQMQKDKSIIRLFDKEHNYISGDESFLDHYLLNRCDEQDKNDSLVVAYTLFDIWEKWGLGEIGDGFLYYRLNTLEKEKKSK